MNTQAPEFNTYHCELTQWDLITITGPDTAKFLQGQVTCDVRELAEPTTRLGAQCNLKGRVMANFRALQMSPETIALCLSKDLVEDTLASLSKYIVFSKAKLHPNNGQFTLFGLYGEQAQELATRYFGQVPAHVGNWISTNGSFLISLDEKRFECWISHEKAAEFSAFLSENSLAVPQNNWQLLDIRAGIAWVNAATRELFTPQALNYELINAISFRKGCYTGQEIVARMHYRGKLKRHTYRYATAGSVLPMPGSLVYKLPNEQTLGEVVASAFSSHSQIELLASVNGDDCDELYLENNPEKLKRLPLPYAIPSGEETPSNT